MRSLRGRLALHDEGLLGIGKPPLCVDLPGDRPHLRWQSTPGVLRDPHHVVVTGRSDENTGVTLPGSRRRDIQIVPRDGVRLLQKLQSLS
jgi:hypothetical protein